MFDVDSKVKASACNAGELGSIPGIRKIPWRRKWQPTPVLLPGESHGGRRLVGYSPWGRKESDTTERLHFHFHFTSTLFNDCEKLLHKVIVKINIFLFFFFCVHCQYYLLCNSFEGYSTLMHFFGEFILVKKLGNITRKTA